MIYYTQLIFVRPGKEDVFHRFEDHVLPLLARYNGKLLLRVRPQADAIIATDVGRPYEVHIISFASKADFAAYAADPARQEHFPLKDESVTSAMLIEGNLV
jgi:hypothetical protein